MDPELIKLIGAYVVGIVLLSVAGYVLVTGGELPEYWVQWITAFIGFAFLIEGIARTIQRRRY